MRRLNHIFRERAAIVHSSIVDNRSCDVILASDVSRNTPIRAALFLVMTSAAAKAWLLFTVGAMVEVSTRCDIMSRPVLSMMSRLPLAVIHRDVQNSL